MPKIPLTSEQKAQLVGFLNYEHDHAIATRSIARQSVIPRSTGTLEMISNDYEFIIRVRDTVRKSRDDDPDLSLIDMETLELIARANEYRDREIFWDSIVESIGKVHRNDSQSPIEIQ